MHSLKPNRWDMYFMDVAERTAELSYATRLKVGCVAVRDRRIIACGFNGTPPGEDNTCEEWMFVDPYMFENIQDKENVVFIEGEAFYKVTKDNVLHAEINLIRFAKQNDINLNGCTLYITHICCEKCAQEVLDAGFKEVKYYNDYRKTEGIDLLRSKIPVYQIER